MSQPLPEIFYLDQSSRGRLCLTGRDRKTFLQGMVTNDVVSLAPGQGCYAFILDATGHVLSDLRILNLFSVDGEDRELLLDVEPGQASFVVGTLDKYLIMERVKITDVSAETGQFFVGGSRAREILEALTVPGISSWSEGENGPLATGNSEAFPARVAATPLPPVQGFTVYLAREDADALIRFLQASGAKAITPELLESLRIEAGIPRFGVDMDARVLAPETGQQKRAIHYRKGCYIGQEIVARIDARGHTNRSLTGFLLHSHDLPPAETSVRVGEKEVGRITSSAIGPRLERPLALGYLRHEYAAPGTQVSIGETEATVAALPFGFSEEAA